VDNFEVKYGSKQHAEHLISILSVRYDISHNWKGKRYLGLDLDWDYNTRCIHISIMSYVANALKRIHNSKPKKAPRSTLPPHQAGL